MTIGRPPTGPGAGTADGSAVVVLAAAAAWAGGAAGLLIGATRATPLGTSLVAAVALVLVLARRFGALRAATVPLVVGLAAAGVAVLRVAPLVTGPFADAAVDRAYVAADVTLTSDPVARQGAVAGSRRTPDRVIAAATTNRWYRAGQWYEQSVSVQLSWTPGAAAPAVLGERLRVSGRLAPADPLRRSAAFLGADSVLVLDAAPPVQRGAAALRESLARAAARTDGDGAALLPGLVLGDTASVSDELAQAMRDSGLAHLTAVSGGNVAVTLGLVWWVARRLGLRRRWRLLLGGVLLPGYVVLVRPEPSVVRAAVMAAIGMAALLAGRRARAPAVLALTVTVLLLLDPFLCLSIGFALSVAATAALVTIGSRWSRAAPSLPRALVSAWAAAAAASLATAPLIAGIGGGVPLLSVPANLLAEPAVGPASVLGLLAAALGVVAPVPAGWLAAAATVPAGWIAGIARRAQAAPGAVLPWPDGWRGAGLLAAVILVAAAAWWSGRRSGRTRPVVAAGVAAALVLVVLPGAGVRLPLASWPPEGWVLVVCDVGQGDGLVLSAGPGAAVVVDTGPDPALMDRCLTRLGVRTVPVVVLSHDHADHVEGLPGVLRGGRRVGLVVVSPLDDPPAESSRVHRWASEEGIPVRAASAGEQLAVGELSWTVLWPDRLLHGTESDPNNASLVLLVRSHGITLLLGGDIEPEAQRLLLRDRPPGEVDVVKVPHHGSLHQDPDYAVATDPEMALISCGVDNGYGHPAAVTLRQYAALGAVVGRTDTEGDLAVVVGPAGGPALLARGK